MLFRSTDSKPPRRTFGQSAVEFALVVIIFFFLVFGVFEVGRLMFMNNTVVNVAREGSHYMAIHPEATTYTMTQAISPTMFLTSPSDPNLGITMTCATCFNCPTCNQSDCSNNPVLGCVDNTGQSVSVTVNYTWTTGVGLPFLSNNVYLSSTSTVGRDR